MKNNDQVITGLLEGAASRVRAPLARLRGLSEYFLECPYLLGALGEGAGGRFDQNPLYRTDAFDCLTYVNTVLALFFSENLIDFQRNMARINYRQGQVAYQQRHHFMSVDWNPENARLGFIRDFTRQINDEEGQPVAVIAETVIDRPNWFRRRELTDIKLESASLEERRRRLTELRAWGDRFTAETSHLPYLPLTRLFNLSGQPNLALFTAIPDGALIEIVRPNWDLRDKIGACVDISHLGFAFWRHNQLIFRDASLLQKKVADTPLIAYLRNYLNHSTIKGINIQLIQL